jgi:hypothetical protein
MRARLLTFAWAGLPRECRQLVLGLKRPVGGDGQNGDAAACVVGGHEEPAARINRLTDAIVAASGGPIDQSCSTGLRIQREGGRIIAVSMN